MPDTSPLNENKVQFMVEINKKLDDDEEIQTFVKSKIIKLASEMAMKKNMPSDCFDDWDWTKSIRSSDWVKVRQAACEAQEQCRLWAIELRTLCDSL